MRISPCTFLKDFLRRHYPHQVTGRNSSSQPLFRLPGPLFNLLYHDFLLMSRVFRDAHMSLLWTCRTPSCWQVLSPRSDPPYYFFGEIAVSAVNNKHTADCIDLTRKGKMLSVVLTKNIRLMTRKKARRIGLFWRVIFLYKTNGVPGGIRTPDLLVRSQSLYPAELRARVFRRLDYYTISFLKKQGVNEKNTDFFC